MEFEVLRPLKKGRFETYVTLDDGAYECEEAVAIVIRVIADGLVHLDFEGLRQPPEEISEDGGKLIFRWRIFPATFAGRSTVVLSSGTNRLSIELDIAPSGQKLGSEQKLGKDAFFDMLKLLTNETSGLAWGTSPGHWAGRQSRSSALISHPASLEFHLPRLRKAILQFARNPLLQVERVTEIRKMSLARRVEPATVISIAKSPSKSVALHQHLNSEGVDPPPLRVRQSVNRITLNHPLARYLVALLNRLAAELENLGSYLERISSGDEEGFRDEASKLSASHLLKNARDIALEVNSLLRSPNLRDITPGPFSEAAAQALINHPASFRLHRVLREMLAPGLEAAQESERQVGLRETWELYEYFVAFQLAATVSEHLGCDWQWTDVQVPQFSYLAIAPRVGEILLPGSSRRLQLMTQKRFRRAQKSGGENGFRSISGQRDPDYVMGVIDEHGELRSWMVLDAKFRANKTGIDEGLGKIHIYRDSLRWSGLAPSAGFAIVPKLVPSTEFYADDDFRDANSFGLLECAISPGENWAAPVLSWLDGEIAR